MEFLYEKLKDYELSDYYPFHMPGHKRNRDMLGVNIPYGIDITEIDGFDDLHHPEGILLEAQERAARMFHAEETWYLVNGSTVGILSAVMGSTSRGGKVLMGRNCHKSVYNAVFLNELHPVYVYPEFDYKNGLNGEIHVQDIKRLLTENPDTEAVVIPSPTYDGVVSDVEKIAAEVHKRRIPLIVDEAHGAHFGFHPYFPANSNVHGADVVIHSLHKTLPSPTQTALLHLNGDLVDRTRIRMFLHMFQTSSPSYILMAAMDECIRAIEERKDEIFCPYVSMLSRTRKILGQLKYMKLIETSVYDRSKLLISTAGTYRNGMVFTGKELYDFLLQKAHLQMEMAAGNYVIAMTGPGDTSEGMDRLLKALAEVDATLCQEDADKTANAALINGISRNNLVYTSFEAEQIRKRLERAEGEGIERLRWKEAAGKISFEYVYLYPPGIPLVVPGEQISQQTAEQIAEYEKMGFSIEGTKKTGKTEVMLNG